MNYTSDVLNKMSLLKFLIPIQDMNSLTTAAYTQNVTNFMFCDVLKPALDIKDLHSSDVN